MAIAKQSPRKPASGYVGASTKTRDSPPTEMSPFSSRVSDGWSWNSTHDDSRPVLCGKLPISQITMELGLCSSNLYLFSKWFPK
jgi:hypothetical protein